MCSANKGIEMVRVGIIGIGFMGVTHFKALKSVKGACVAAICTRDTKKLAGDWRSIKGNFGDAGGVQNLSRIARYQEIDSLLSDESIDLVDICLPTHLHREVTIAALRAGKHVLVEKPIALTLKDADAMVAAAEKAGRLLMVGQVLRFFPAFAEAYDLVHNKKYGELVALHLKRIIAQPSWSSDDHFSDDAKSGGPVIDLHIHDTDFVQHLAGAPQGVQAAGYKKGGEARYITTQYLYSEKPCAISAHSGAVSMPGVPFEHGFDLYLERATLRYNNLSTGEEVLLATADGKVKSYKPRRKDAFEVQLQHAVDCVRKNRESSLISAKAARTSLQICLAERRAVLSGRSVRIITT
jgi:predicted dehydrogenase